MAYVTDIYGFSASQDKGFKLPLSIAGFARLAAFALAIILSASWIIAALGTLETIIPAYAPVAPSMRRIPLTLTHQGNSPSARIRQSFIKAYTAQSAYSNLDWRRNTVSSDKLVITDVGPDSVIDGVPLADIIAEKLMALKATALAFATILQNAEQNRFKLADRTVPIPEPIPAPQAATATANLEDNDGVMPGEVPLPGKKPALLRPQPQDKTRLVHAPESTKNIEADSPGRRLFGSLFGHAARSRVAIYDIAAATVYLPNGEKLEAHSGLGQMRDNPRYVTQKNRGPTPPHTYNLRMREALFHGVEAIRLTPMDGNNRYNRDGLLAHTFMLGKRGDSNGCVVFRDYARFLRAFKRGEIRQLVVVPHMSTQQVAYAQ